MQLYRKDDIKALEQEAQALDGVKMTDLVRRAGETLAMEVALACGSRPGLRAAILCGKGNNGADGFICAVALQRMGWQAAVILAQGAPQTEEARWAFEQLPPQIPVTENPGTIAAALDGADVIVDCIFGFGFSGELPHRARSLTEYANARNCLRISADLPSGVECDSGRAARGTFRAHVTVCFTACKPACFSYPAKDFFGSIRLCPVGVLPQRVAARQTSVFLTDGEFLQRVWPAPADPQVNKGDMGRLLMVCGSMGMAGACILAARAALRTGIGFLHIAADQRIYPILAGALPEAVFTVLDWEQAPDESREKLLSAMDRADAVLMGCGLGELAPLVCETVYSRCRVPLLADADALNAAARQPELLAACTAPMVLTPHPGEMARLCSTDIPEIQKNRLDAALTFALDHSAVVALKGAATVVADSRGRLAVNPSGNPGMAKAGSGDVLAGIIGGLLARGLSPFDAAVCGVFLHGAAGDLCAAELGQAAMQPSDIISALPRCLPR